MTVHGHVRQARERLVAAGIPAEEAALEEHDQAENDPPVVEPVEDGSNVVSVDFKRKK